MNVPQFSFNLQNIPQLQSLPPIIQQSTPVMSSLGSSSLGVMSSLSAPNLQRSSMISQVGLHTPPMPAQPVPQTVTPERVPVVTENVPPQVAEYRQLSREERALRMVNPKLMATTAMRCYTCKKPIRQLALEELLRTGQSLARTMDELGYDRICCRDLITGEPAIVNLIKGLDQTNATINRMRHLTISNTAPSFTDRGTQFSSAPNYSGTGIRIVTEAPPGQMTLGLQCEPSQIVGTGGICIGIGESFAEEPVHTGDAFEYFMNELEDVDEDAD